MSNHGSTSKLDAYKKDIIEWKGQGYNNKEVSDLVQMRFGFVTTRDSIRRALRRWRVEAVVPSSKLGKAYTKVSGDNAEVLGAPSTTNLNDPDALLRERGLDPEEWEVVSLTVNEWDSPTGETMKQLKASLKRKRPLNLILPARSLGYIHKRRAKPEKSAKLTIVASDHHAPFHDKNLHRLTCDWLSENKPDNGVINGDWMDFPEISRHRHKPEWKASTQDCIEGAYEIGIDYVTSSEETEWEFQDGNHDERIRLMIIDQAKDLFGIHRPGEIESVFDLSHLLRMDELGIKYRKPHGTYDQGEIKLTEKLAARHGWLVRKESGQSAMGTLRHLGYSILIGHTHRMGEVFHTTHDINGEQTVLTGVEGGCMCIVKGGLGYSVSPDWQNGFITVVTYPDGTFNVELAKYVNGRLLWRDQIYT